MRRNASLVVVAGLLCLSTVACQVIPGGDERAAFSLAKRELQQTARQFNVEMRAISKNSAGWEYTNPTPSERIEGVEKYLQFWIEYAYRCVGDEEWRDVAMSCAFRRTHGKWEFIGVREGGPLHTQCLATLYRVDCECALHAPPRDWDERQANREILEEHGDLRNVRRLRRYVGSASLYTQWLTVLVGPTWMFAPGLRRTVEWYAGREFSDEEFEQFRTDPEKAAEWVQMLGEPTTQDRLGNDGPEILAMYQKALAFELELPF